MCMILHNKFEYEILFLKIVFLILKNIQNNRMTDVVATFYFDKLNLKRDWISCKYYSENINSHSIDR